MSDVLGHNSTPKRGNVTPPKRKPKARPKAQPRFRNAAPATPRPRAIPPAASTNGSVPGQPESGAWHLAHTAIGAGVASGLGVLATKVGIPPMMVAAVITGVGSYASVTRDTARSRSLTAGAASMAGSQLLLLTLKPWIGKADPVAPTVIVATATQPPSAPTHKNADLGALPSGALDAAFERARAQLAVSGDMHDMHAHGDHDHEHTIHHQTVPFIP